MRQRTLVIAAMAGLWIIPSMTLGRDIRANSTGGLDINAGSNFFLPLVNYATTGSIAVENWAGNVTGGVADFVNTSGPPFAAWPVAPVCGGAGLFNAPKFPAPAPPFAKTLSGSMNIRYTDPVVPANNVISASSAGWSTNQVLAGPPPGLPLSSSGRLTTRANVIRNGPQQPAGQSDAQSVDPWIFQPEEQTDIHLTITLSDVQLSVEDDGEGPPDGTAAGLQVDGGFGYGATPGTGTLVSWNYSRTVSDGDPAFAASGITLYDGTLSLQPGQTYWLAASLDSSVSTPDLFSCSDPKH